MRSCTAAGAVQAVCVERTRSHKPDIAEEPPTSRRAGAAVNDGGDGSCRVRRVRLTTLATPR